MAHKRHIRWDVHFLDDGTGALLYDKFGSAGVSLFLGFVCACKRNLVPGQMTYGSDVDLLAQVGLPGLQLVNEAGEPWTVDEFWTWLGQRKQTRRRQRGRLTNVTSTRWERWQKDWNTEEERDRKRRSRAKSDRDTSGTTLGHDPDETVTDTDTDTETTTTSEPDVSDAAIQLTLRFIKAAQRNRHKVPQPETKRWWAWMVEMDRLLRLDGATFDEVFRVIDWCAQDTGNGTYPGESVNVQSVPKLRERFSQLLGKANAAERSNVTELHFQTGGTGKVVG